ncbi:Serine/threonineprotein kinase RIO2like, partial [Caligus rogercresseyi]
MARANIPKLGVPVVSSDTSIMLCTVLTGVFSTARPGFPVPEPIDFNRHCVVMEYIKGTPLQNIREVDDPGALYEKLMNLHIKFASHGVIHGDFNEFNIMITEEGEPIVIDFPQMISASHPEAEAFFARDVECLKEFFKRRFDFECESAPDFLRDVRRTDVLDAEVRASGMTKQMEKDILVELGIDEEEGSSNEEQEESDGEENILNDDEVISSEVSHMTLNEKNTSNTEKDDFFNSIPSDNLPEDPAFPEIPPPPPEANEGEYYEAGDQVGSLPNFKDEVQSVRSFASSTASTIHPDVIKQRVKATLEKRK